MTRRLTPPLALILAASLAGCSAQVEQAASADFMPIFPLAADYQPAVFLSVRSTIPINRGCLLLTAAQAVSATF